MGRTRKNLGRRDLLGSDRILLDIPLKSIYYDDEFNCRGPVTYESVIGLSQGIDKVGLQYPLIVWEREGLPEGKSYQILAGHRRYRAIELLGHDVVLSFVRRGIDEYTARRINLSENIERVDLNILEEATALYKMHGELPMREIAREMNQSFKWVQDRYRLLKFPEEVQQMLAAGRIPGYTIRKLWKILQESGEQAVSKAAVQFEHAKNERGLIENQSLPKHLRSRKRPSNEQIFAVVIKLLEHKVEGFLPRFGAFMAGYLSEEDLIQELEDTVSFYDRLDALEESSGDVEKRLRAIERKLKRK